jgi:hypothetical protein
MGITLTVNDSANNRGLWIAIVAGCVIAALTLAISRWYSLFSGFPIGVVQRYAYIFLLPGLFCAIAVSGNVHDFSLGVAAIGNLVFYVVFFWAATALVRMIRRRNR